MSGTGIDVVPKLPKCPVPVIPAVYTGGMPRYVPYRTHACNLGNVNVNFEPHVHANGQPVYFFSRKLWALLYFSDLDIGHTSWTKTEKSPAFHLFVCA